MWVRSLLQTIYIYIHVSVTRYPSSFPDSSEASLNAMAPTAIAAVAWSDDGGYMGESYAARELG